MKPTEFREITQSNGHYAVQGRSRSFKVSDFGTNRKHIIRLINSKLHSIFHRFQVTADYTVCKIFVRDSSVFDSLRPTLGWSPANIAISDIPLKTRFVRLHFTRRMYRCILNHLYVIRPQSYRIRRNNANYTAITPFKVIQGHRFWYQWKGHNYATSY